VKEIADLKSDINTIYNEFSKDIEEINKSLKDILITLKEINKLLNRYVSQNNEILDRLSEKREKKRRWWFWRRI